MGLVLNQPDLTEDGVYTRFAARALSIPGAMALTVDDRALSYEELRVRVERCAAALQAHGCGVGSAVVCALPNSTDFVVVALATFAIGGILAPLNPRFKDDEFRHCIETSAAKAVFHAPALEALMTSLVEPGVLRAADADFVANESQVFEVARVDPGAPALYMFSSGSTGKSKRVTRTQGHLLAEYDALSRTASLSADDRILCTVPLYHAHGFCNSMMAALMSGGTMVLPTTDFNARDAMSLLVRHRVTVYPAVPFMFKMLCDTRFSTPPDLSRLRLAFIAGAPLPLAVSARFCELYGKTVGQLYGSTESGAITLNVANQADKPGSVGKPLHGFEVQIRNEEGQVLGPDESGEIWIRTPATTRQYDGLPELSKEHFEGEYFFAGDVGSLDAEGCLYVTGRKKLMINVAGNKVDPIEVEDVLARHPQIAESVVIGVPHAGYGERIKAVVTLRKDAGECDERELIRFVSSHLVEYKVPKLIEFRDEIPRSPLGKILRKYL